MRLYSSAYEEVTYFTNDRRFDLGVGKGSGKCGGSRGLSSLGGCYVATPSCHSLLVDIIIIDIIL